MKRLSLKSSAMLGTAVTFRCPVDGEHTPVYELRRSASDRRVHLAVFCHGSEEHATFDKHVVTDDYGMYGAPFEIMRWLGDVFVNDKIPDVMELIKYNREGYTR